MVCQGCRYRCRNIQHQQFRGGGQRTQAPEGIAARAYKCMLGQAELCRPGFLFKWIRLRADD